METRGILVDVNIAAKKIQQKNNPIVIDFYIILAFEIQQESLSNPLKRGFLINLLLFKNCAVNQLRIGRIFFAKYDCHATWFDELQPLAGLSLPWDSLGSMNCNL